MRTEMTSLCEEFTLGRTRQAVIFLPGLCGTYQELGSIPKLVRDLGHTTCTPKINGYYAQTDLETYDIWLAELDQVVDWLYEDHDDVVIVGLSMGATLALAYEADYQKTQGVVALSPVLAYDGWSVPWYYPLLYFVFKLGIDGWHYKESEPYGLRNPEVRRRVAKQIQEQETTEVGSASLSAKHLYQGLRLIAFTKKMVNQFKADLLVISSIDDDVVSPPTTEWLCKTVSSPTRKLIWLGGSYHIITLDNEREIVVNESVEFIQGIFGKAKTLMSYSEEAKQLIIRDRLAE